MTVIHQVTDIHIPVTGDLSVRDNFTRLMQHVASAQPDILTITGDLPGEDGSREAYLWIRDQLPSDIPCLVLPGNHDDPAALFAIFQSEMNTNPEFFEIVALDQIDLVFANTASNYLPSDQIASLADVSIREGSLLFLHHPTEEISGGFMDRTYPLLNRDEVSRAISDSNIEHVFCGHFHTEYLCRTTYNLHLTPSPAFTVDRDSVKPIISPPGIPLREIAVEGALVSTRVIYLEEESRHCVK